MTLKFKTSNANDFKNEIIKLINEGKLSTWELLTINSTEYLKHIGQWGEKGAIKLTKDNDNKYLTSQVFKFDSYTGKVEDFEGYYLGRFCELIFVNFPKKFSSIDKN